MSVNITPAGVDQDVLLEFFLTFARFEFALKNAGFFQRPRNIDPADPPDVHPDWDCFTVSIRQALERDKTPEFAEAYEYLLDHPPAREVLVNGSLMWEAKAPSAHLPFADRVLQCVRRVRNISFMEANSTRFKIVIQTEITGCFSTQLPYCARACEHHQLLIPIFKRRPSNTSVERTIEGVCVLSGPR